MTTQFTDYYQNSSLAQASYVSFSNILNKDQVIKDLQDNFSETQATQFAAEYTVVDQYEDSLLGFTAGFSATVFKDKSDQYTIAIRGTGTFDLADWAENFGNIGADGIAIEQAIELFNYVQRLITPAGSPLTQYEFGYEYISAGSLPNPSISSQTTTALNNGALSHVSSGLNVAGHSLGGHLSIIMSRLFPDLTAQTFTFNAPGFDTGTIGEDNTDWFFDALTQAEIDATETSNISSHFNENQLNQITIKQDFVSDIGDVQDSQIPIYSEYVKLNGIQAHSIEAMTDALAVYDLYSILNTSLNNETMTSLLEASSSQASNSVETSVSQLAQPLGVDIKAIQTDNGDSFYTAIEAIKKDDAYDQIIEQGGVDFQLLTDSASTLESQAKTDDAVMYSLLTLTPFTITGSGAAAVYQKFEDQYDLFDSATDEGGITDEYLKDRAQMFEVMMSANANNSILHNSNDSITYEDQGSHSVISNLATSRDSDKSITVACIYQSSLIPSNYCGRLSCSF